MKTAVIYARYSSDSQTEQSIEGQLRVCEDYAKSHDIVIVNTYIDRAMTGTNDNRPAFQRMLKDSNRKEWDFILVYKFDRFSRNKYETAIHKKELKDNGVKVVSATEFVPDTPEGIIFESMLEGYAEYYSAELSQKIRRGNSESRRKGNLTGGIIPYGYKNVNKKAVIVPEHADVVRYIYSQYSAGVFVKDIIADLSAKGIFYYGKPFVQNTIYKILKNERYSGIYRFNGEVFDNIYPQIVPTEIFEKVRKKVNENRYGKQSLAVEFLLRHKIKCGYCGYSVMSDSGTAYNGEKKYYYKCRGRKAKFSDCQNKPIRKEVLEKIVIDSIIEELSDKSTVDYIVSQLLDIQENQAKTNVVLNLLIKEKQTTDTAITNIMTAIENGGSTCTAMKRMRELEQRQEELQKLIALEKSKTPVLLTADDIRNYYFQALRLEPKLLINYLIKEIILYKDKIEIHYNSPVNIGPDENRDFSFATKSIKLSIKVPYRKNKIKIGFEIQMFVQ